MKLVEICTIIAIVIGPIAAAFISLRLQTRSAQRQQKLNVLYQLFKWLEILKASGWQTGALATAFGLFIVMVNVEIIPTTSSPLWIALPAVAGLVCLFLSLAAIGEALTKLFKPGLQFSMWRIRRSEQKEVREYIPYMNENDKRTIGLCLYHNLQTIQVNLDAGEAVQMISKGIIRIAVYSGQRYSRRRVPHEFPLHIWKVLGEHKERFPYKPPPK